MIRGIEGKRIFRDTLDRKDFVTRLGDLSKQTGTRLFVKIVLKFASPTARNPKGGIWPGKSKSPLAKR
jgi:hypothetical protein